MNKSAIWAGSRKDEDFQSSWINCKSASNKVSGTPNGTPVQFKLGGLRGDRLAIH